MHHLKFCMCTIRLTITFLLSAFFGSGMANAEAAHLEPLIPLNAMLTHWDNHWFVWMPKNPTYESIEVMSTDALNGEKPYVWVFLTERAGQKKQIHYFNDRKVAWPGTTIREIAYEQKGENLGKSVHVSLLDEKNSVIDLNVTVDPTAIMQKAGLTDQSGHAAGSIFLLFFREWQVNAINNRVFINGVDYSFNSSEGVTDKYYFMSAYSKNVFTAIIPFGEYHVKISNGIISHSWGMNFSKQEADGKIYFKSSTALNGSFINLLTDSKGGLYEYSRNVGIHNVKIKFSKPLQTSMKENSSNIDYYISLDEFENIVTGKLKVNSSSNSINLEWENENPKWAKSMSFTSRINMDSDGEGYSVVVNSIK